MNIKRFTSKMHGANTYILHNEGSGIIVDPCTKIEKVSEYCINENIKIELIVLTHCHIDHTLYLQEYIKKFEVKFAIHRLGDKYNINPELNGAKYFGLDIAFDSADILLKDKQILNFGKTKITVISTPGHSPGSICLYGEGILLSGDTLFRLSIGRSDLPGGNYNKLKESLKVIMNLPETTVIYPGHGAFSTIEFEKKHNPFLQV